MRVSTPSNVSKLVLSQLKCNTRKDHFRCTFSSILTKNILGFIKHSQFSSSSETWIYYRVPIYSFKSSRIKRKEQIIFAKTDKKLFNECTADPLSSLVSQLESLPISATALLQSQGGLSSLGSSPGTWAEVRKSLHQANCLGPYHCYACGASGVAHHLAQEAVGVTLPSSSSTHPSAPCFSKAP